MLLALLTRADGSFAGGIFGATPVVAGPLVHLAGSASQHPAMLKLLSYKQQL